MKMLLVVLALCVSGCAGMQGSNLSADQLNAISANSSLAGGCVTVVGPWGTARTVFVKIDKGSEVNGSVVVDPNTCAVSVSNAVVVVTTTPAPAVPATTLVRPATPK